MRGSSYEQAPDEGYVSQNWGSSNVAYKMLDRTDYLDVFDIIKPVAKYNEPVTPELLRRLKTALEDEASGIDVYHAFLQALPEFKFVTLGEEELLLDELEPEL